jgi:hypothetical protein
MRAFMKAKRKDKQDKLEDSNEKGLRLQTNTPKSEAPGRCFARGMTYPEASG